MRSQRQLPIGVAMLVTTTLWAPIPAGAQTLDFDPPGAPAIGDFSAVTLNGNRQLASLTIAPFTADSTGSGAGWHVTLTVPDLVNGGSTIPASSISMEAPVVAAAGGADITGVVGHASTGNLGAGESIVTADVGRGDGSYLVSPELLKVEIPPTAIAGTYVSGASLGVVSGP